MLRCDPLVFDFLGKLQDGRDAFAVKQAGIHGGLVIHLGCGNGQITAALGSGNRLLIQGFDTDPKSIAAARSRISSLGHYGRISVDRFDGRHLPLIDNLANVIVASGTSTVDQVEVLRVLVPGGRAFVQQDDDWRGAARNYFSAENLRLVTSPQRNQPEGAKTFLADLTAVDLVEA